MFGDKNTKIASAIIDKGVPTSANAIGDQMATNIRAIETGKKVVESTVYVSGISGASRTSVTLSIGFVARNASTEVNGLKLMHGSTLVGSLWTGLSSSYSH